MLSRQSLVVAVLLTISLVGSSVEANLEAYRFEPSLDGFYQRCTAKYLTGEIAAVLGNGRLQNFLLQDFYEIDRSISEDNPGHECWFSCLVSIYNPLRQEKLKNLEKAPQNEATYIQTVKWVTNHLHLGEYETLRGEYKKCREEESRLKEIRLRKYQAKIQQFQSIRNGPQPLTSSSQDQA